MKFLYFLNKFFNPIYWYSVLRPQHSLADKSNRFWKPILLWFCFTHYEDVLALSGWKISQWGLIKKAMFHEEEFVPFMPFLQYDLWKLLVIMFREE